MLPAGRVRPLHAPALPLARPLCALSPQCATYTPAACPCGSCAATACPLFARLLAITCHVCAYSSRNPRCSPITCPLFARSTVVECPLCARCSPITCPVRAPDAGPLLALMCALLAHHPLSQPGAPLRAHRAPVCACTPCLLGQRFSRSLPVPCLHWQYSLPAAHLHRQHFLPISYLPPVSGGSIPMAIPGLFHAHRAPTDPSTLQGAAGREPPH